MTQTDREAIVQTINLYGLAVDSRRWELFDKVFTQDVEAIYGVRHWRDLAIFKAEFGASHEVFHHTQHAMANHIIHINGGEAEAFTYVAWRLTKRNEAGEDVREGAAWYDDQIVRARGTWLIRKRVCNVASVRRTLIDRATLDEMERLHPTIQVRDEARNGGVPILRHFI